MSDLRDLCESCGQPAHVKLDDDSTWCFACHDAALNLGYDDDFGDAASGVGVDVTVSALAHPR